jgi:hypothetical protein
MSSKGVTSQAVGQPVAGVTVEKPRDAGPSEAGCEGTMAVRSQQPPDGEVSAGADDDDAGAATRGASGGDATGAGEPRGAGPSEAGCEGTMAVRSQQSPDGEVSAGAIGSSIVGGDGAAVVRGRQRRRETPLQRENRLARQREYNNRRRQRQQSQGGDVSAGADGDKIACNGGDADVGQLLRETPQQREHRLSRQREYNNRRRKTIDTVNRESRTTHKTHVAVAASSAAAIDERDNAELACLPRESIPIIPGIGEINLLRESEEHHSVRLAPARLLSSFQAWECCQRVQ